jgi:hypothetical protein
MLLTTALTGIGIIISLAIAMNSLILLVISSEQRRSSGATS